MMENVLGDLEVEVLDLATMPSKAGEEVRTDETASEEVARDRGLEENEHEVVQVDDKGE